MRLRLISATILAGALVVTTLAPAYATAPDGWSDPSNVWNDVSVSGQAAFDPQITAAPDGTLTAIWRRLDSSAVSIIQTSNSSDHGATWSIPVNLSAPGGNASDPQITVAPNGDLAAIWRRVDGGVNVVQARTSTDGGTTWGSTTNLSDGIRTATDPQITATPDNTFTAVWRVNDTGRWIVQTRNSAVGGATWGSVTDLSDTSRNGNNPQIAVAQDSSLTTTLAAVWVHSGGGAAIVQVRTSTDNGATWSAPVDLTTSGLASNDPRIIAAPNGDLTVIWNRNDPGGSLVQTRTSTDGGANWAATNVLSATGGNATGARVIAAPDGTLAAVWYRYDGSHNIVQTRASTDGGATWGAVSDLSAPGQAAYGARVTSTPDSTLAAIWYRNDGTKNVVQVSTSTDQGLTWTPASDLSESSQNAINPQITSTPDGTLTAIWARYDGITYVIQSVFGMTAPVITSAAPPNAEVGDAYSFQVTASGVPDPTFTVSSGALPTGLTMSPAGLIGGTPTTLGDFTFTVTASNGAAPDATATYTITTLAAPVITSGTPPDPEMGVAYSFQVTATGTPDPTFSITAGTLPAGLTLSSAGLINGTPTVSGNFTFTITASNGVSPDATAIYTFTLAPLSAPVITSGTPPTPRVGDAYSFVVTASGNPSPTITIGSGALPTGLTLNLNGEISGVPTSTGSFTFTITASNGVSPDATAAYTLSPRAALAFTGAGTTDSLVLWSFLLLILGAGFTLASKYRRQRS